MPKNVMKLMKSSPNVARNDFDLSHRHLLTANIGELLPVSFIETVPGDFIKMRISDLVRAIPLVTSPFMRVKQHVDVWFVPYHYLWSNFEEFITQKSQPSSSSLKKSAFVPHENLNYIQGIINGAEDTDTDIVGRAWSIGAKKLYDLCGYGLSTTVSSSAINLWRIAAYNKIWYDEYRQKYYDAGIRFMDEDANSDYSIAAASFNFDDLSCTSESTSRLSGGSGLGDSENRIKEMFQMRYRLWKKDLYTGLLPSTQFGVVSSVLSEGPVGLANSGGDDFHAAAVRGYDNISYGPYAPQFTNGTAGSVGYARRDDGTTGVIQVNKYLYANTSVDVLQLRKSEALQIWRERALRAGNRISDNMRGHYGDDAEYTDNRPVLLGSVDSPLNIGDIDATSQTGTGVNQSLGDVAGKGLSSMDEKVFSFKAHKFGVIVTLVSFLPESEYLSNGIDRMNQLIESEDYFTPEYQDLGLEAVSSFTFDSSVPVRVLGYAPRYFGYKTKLDKVFSTFMRDFPTWASPKTDVNIALRPNSSVLPLSTLYVNPALFDNNFVVSIQNSEQFLIDMFFDVDAVRPMSVSGLPRF